ncbi:MAG: MMPL family transporter [Hyphomicrobiaceae bacterium]|nr:MMPL family transporter [Hyphomicrobiaceae bacterium]MCC0008061.1 MMPL family transporter [Hyphomicrobiaceae bacterium]
MSEELRRAYRFSFGLDRLGLIALKAPMLSALLIAIITALAVVGFLHLKVDDSLSELFRTNTAEFRQYEEIDRRFPSSEYDVLVVVDGPMLLARENLERFANLAIELNLAEGVNGLISMLSARDKPDANGYAPPLIPDLLPEGDAYTALIARLKSNDIVAGKFLSDDGELALMVISLDRQAVAEKGPRQIIGNIQKAVDAELQGSGLNAKLTGAPVMQLEIRNAVERDRLIYNGLGFVVGIVVAYLFFRRISLTLIAVAGPAIAILWTLGALGALDFRLNLFINVITPLILVAGFSDSMHLVFSVRRSILMGVNRIQAARDAVLDVAPACLLTAMNAALAILSFQFADSALIKTFGTAALMAVGISYFAVAVVVPTLAALLVSEEPATRVGDRDAEEGGVGVLQHVTEAIVQGVARWPVLFSALGIIAVVATGIAYSKLVPMYRLADQVPDKEQALAGTAKLDQKLTGANPIHVMISWDSQHKLYDPDTLKVIGEAHDVLQHRAGLGNVWSMESLRRWLAEAGDTSVETLKSYVKILPEHLVRRFVDGDERAVLVTARMPDIDASEILPVVEQIDAALKPVRAANPGYEIAVTGLPAIAARNSAKLIDELNWGLVGDMFVIFIFLGLALRSWLAGLASVLPSLFPIFATGTLLYLTGQGLQFASIIAITVAFSLAIDSTIHFLNRYHLEEMRLKTGSGVEHTRQSLVKTMHHIGPAVILTTIVLALGLGVTMLSDLPSLRQFGQLTAVCLMAALIGQLVILPATTALIRRFIPAPKVD